MTSELKHPKKHIVYTIGCLFSHRMPVTSEHTSEEVDRQVFVSVDLTLMIKTIQSKTTNVL